MLNPMIEQAKRAEKIIAARLQEQDIADLKYLLRKPGDEQEPDNETADDC